MGSADALARSHQAHPPVRIEALYWLVLPEPCWFSVLIVFLAIWYFCFIGLHKFEWLIHPRDFFLPSVYFALAVALMVAVVGWGWRFSPTRVCFLLALASYLVWGGLMLVRRYPTPKGRHLFKLLALGGLLSGIPYGVWGFLDLAGDAELLWEVGGPLGPNYWVGWLTFCLGVGPGETRSFVIS